MQPYHVSVPSTMIYYVEAKDEDDARVRVEAAIAGTPIDPDACWIMNDLAELAQPDKWDVTYPHACHGCGCWIDPDVHPTACASCV